MPMDDAPPHQCLSNHTRWQHPLLHAGLGTASRSRRGCNDEGASGVSPLCRGLPFAPVDEGRSRSPESNNKTKKPMTPLNVPVADPSDTVLPMPEEWGAYSQMVGEGSPEKDIRAKMSGDGLSDLDFFRFMTIQLSEGTCLCRRVKEGGPCVSCC